MFRNERAPLPYLGGEDAPPGGFDTAGGGGFRNERAPLPFLGEEGVAVSIPWFRHGIAVSIPWIRQGEVIYCFLMAFRRPYCLLIVCPAEGGGRDLVLKEEVGLLRVETRDSTRRCRVETRESTRRRLPPLKK